MNPALAGTVFEGDFVAGNIAADGNSTVGETALFYDFPSVNGSAPSVVGGGDVGVVTSGEVPGVVLPGSSVPGVPSGSGGPQGPVLFDAVVSMSAK